MNAMPHAVMLMALATHLKTREHMVEALTVLRRKVREEQARDVRRRSLRVRHYATLDCIPDPRDSDWMKLWRNGSDENFIHYTSLDRISFCRLLEQFSPYYKLLGYNHKGGRPPRLHHKHQALAVVLTFYVDSHHEKRASVYFGAPPSTLSRVLNSAEEALGKALASFRPARISWPSGARQRALAKLTALREPLLQFAWGFIDGKNLKVLQPADTDVQNAFYNGWLHNVFVTGTLCFSADGLIVWARHNCPGSWNDSENCVGFRDNLLDPRLSPDMRYGVVADSAFPCSGMMIGRILTPLKEGDLGRLLPSVRASAKIMSRAITYIRQSAEWGMGSVEKVYKRLLLPLPPDKDKRSLRLDNLFRLSNFRVRALEISQIRTTYFYGVVDNQ